MSIKFPKLPESFSNIDWKQGLPGLQNGLFLSYERKIEQIYRDGEHYWIVGLEQNAQVVTIFQQINRIREETGMKETPGLIVSAFALLPLVSGWVIDKKTQIDKANDQALAKNERPFPSIFDSYPNLVRYAYFIQDYTGAACQVAGVVNCVALFYLGQTTYASFALTMIIMGYLDRNYFFNKEISQGVETAMRTMTLHQFDENKYFNALIKKIKTTNTAASQNLSHVWNNYGEIVMLVTSVGVGNWRARLNVGMELANKLLGNYIEKVVEQRLDKTFSNVNNEQGLSLENFENLLARPDQPWVANNQHLHYKTKLPKLTHTVDLDDLLSAFDKIDFSNGSTINTLHTNLQKDPKFKASGEDADTDKYIQALRARLENIVRRVEDKELFANDPTTQTRMENMLGWIITWINNMDDPVQRTDIILRIGFEAGKVCDTGVQTVVESVYQGIAHDAQLTACPNPPAFDKLVEIFEPVFPSIQGLQAKRKERMNRSLDDRLRNQAKLVFFQRGKQEAIKPVIEAYNKDHPDSQITFEEVQTFASKVMRISNWGEEDQKLVAFFDFYSNFGSCKADLIKELTAILKQFKKRNSEQDFVVDDVALEFADAMMMHQPLPEMAEQVEKFAKELKQSIEKIVKRAKELDNLQETEIPVRLQWVIRKLEELKADREAQKEILLELLDARGKQQIDQTVRMVHRLKVQGVVATSLKDRVHDALFQRRLNLFSEFYRIIMYKSFFADFIAFYQDPESPHSFNGVIEKFGPIFGLFDQENAKADLTVKKNLFGKIFMVLISKLLAGGFSNGLSIPTEDKSHSLKFWEVITIFPYMLKLLRYEFKVLEGKANWDTLPPYNTDTIIETMKEMTNPMPVTITEETTLEQQLIKKAEGENDPQRLEKLKKHLQNETFDEAFEQELITEDELSRLKQEGKNKVVSTEDIGISKHQNIKDDEIKLWFRDWIEKQKQVLLQEAGINGETLDQVNSKLDDITEQLKAERYYRSEGQNNEADSANHQVTQISNELDQMMNPATVKKLIKLLEWRVDYVEGSQMHEEGGILQDKNPIKDLFLKAMLFDLNVLAVRELDPETTLNQAQASLASGSLPIDLRNQSGLTQKEERRLNGFLDDLDLDEYNRRPKSRAQLRKEKKWSDNQPEPTTRLGKWQKNVSVVISVYSSYVWGIITNAMYSLTQAKFAPEFISKGSNTLFRKKTHMQIPDLGKRDAAVNGVALKFRKLFTSFAGRTTQSQKTVIAVVQRKTSGKDLKTLIANATNSSNHFPSINEKITKFINSLSDEEVQNLFNELFPFTNPFPGVDQAKEAIYNHFIVLGLQNAYDDCHKSLELLKLTSRSNYDDQETLIKRFLNELTDVQLDFLFNLQKQKHQNYRPPAHSTLTFGRSLHAMTQFMDPRDKIAETLKEYEKKSKEEGADIAKLQKAALLQVKLNQLKIRSW